jgi:multidrug resistance efflux pump
MARVNRTTGIFLILGVVALLGTVAGARLLAPGEHPAPVETQESSDVFCTGFIDALSGLLKPGPKIMGKVQEIIAKDGKTVKKGDELIRLEDQTARDELAIARQELEVAKAKLANAREQSNTDIKILEQQNRVDQAASRYEVLQKNFEETKKSSELNVARKAELENAEILVRQAKRDWDAASAVLAKLKSIDPNVALKEHDEELKAQKLKVAAAEAALENFVIRAPADGTVVEINYQVGGPCPLPPGDAHANRALVMLPNEPLIVRAEVGQEWALLVKVGQKATITVRAAAGREFTWTGTVEKVAAYLEKSRNSSVEPDQFVNARTRECIIKINPSSKNNEIVHGTRVSVQIHTAE